MSTSSHELALLTQVEALADNLQGNNFATQKGFTESFFFSQEDLNGNALLYIEGHPTLRGRIKQVSWLNLTTDLTAGGSLDVGITGTISDYLLTRIHLLEANNVDNATDQDGVAQIYPFLDGPLASGGIGAANVIPASQLILFTFTDVSSDTGIGDVIITIEWFE